MGAAGATGCGRTSQRQRADRVLVEGCARETRPSPSRKEKEDLGTTAVSRPAANAGTWCGSQAARLLSNWRVQASHPERSARSRQAWGFSVRAPKRCAGEIFVQRTGHAVIDDIDRARHRKSGDRHTARHRLEIHETEGVGETREHEYVCGRDMSRELFAKLVPSVSRVWILLLQPRQLRTVSHHDLGSMPGHTQKRVDVLLDGNAPDIGRDRSRQVRGISCRKDGRFPYPRHVASVRCS